MAIYFIFVDGIGLGEPHEKNPFTVFNPPSFSRMCGGSTFDKNAMSIDRKAHLFRAIDARLGIEGLPQSGTGQAALFSGQNAARLLGKHFGPFPHSEIKYLLEEESLFHQVHEQGGRCYFMNAYPDLFFERRGRRRRWTCTTLMARSAGVRLNREEDVREGRAITAEIINSIWREQLQIDLPEIEPESAADRMLRMGEEQDLLLFEYFLTDKVGHARDMEWGRRILQILDRFLMRLIRQLPPGDSIVLSSDHGNMEDLTRKTHTMNKVPLFVKGGAASKFKGAESITDIAGGIEQALK